MCVCVCKCTRIWANPLTPNLTGGVPAAAQALFG